MLNLEELEQLVAFDELGTLSKVAEKFLISTPSLSRNMQHLEEDFGCTLFDRSANRISLNETGKRAVEVAKRILNTTQSGIEEVQTFDQSLKTITVVSAAPAPLWKLLPQLSQRYPHKQIRHQIMTTEETLSAINQNTVDIAVLPFAYLEKAVETTPYMEEQLFVAVAPDHELAQMKTVHFSDLNGYNFLLMNQIGFWDALVREKMPASRFLVQSSTLDFDELAKNSTLPRFVTNISLKKSAPETNRVMIPIIDPEAQITYSLVSFNKELSLKELLP